MYFTVPLWKTGSDLQVWVIPLRRAGAQESRLLLLAIPPS